ncbi:MAG: uncharacterized protein QOF51_821, partial [Chloroflexota bacterium]|nr:uncharacterized protein [Chloroflexota bacterium]
MDTFPQTQERSQPQLAGPLVVIGAIVVLLLVFAGVVDFSTEWLWFSSLNVASVFVTTLWARLALFVLGAAVFSVIFGVNVAIARRLAYSFDVRPRRGRTTTTWEDLLAQVGAQVGRRGDYTRLINAGVLLVGALLALFMGLAAAGNWVVALQFVNRTPFGI